jgi:hypothetical protein
MAYPVTPTPLPRDPIGRAPGGYILAHPVALKLTSLPGVVSLNQLHRSTRPTGGCE